MLAVLTLAAAGGTAYAVSQHGRAIHLDNAFVTGRVIRLAAPVSGPVEAVGMARFSVLPGGASAFRVNARSLSDRVSSAELSLHAALSEIGRDCLRLDSQAEKVDLTRIEAQLAETKLSDARRLMESGFISKRQIEQQEFDARKAATSHQIEVLERQRLHIATSGQPGSSRDLAEAVGVLRRALIEQHQATVSVNKDVFVYDVHVLPGQWVEQGAPLATVIPLEAVRVQANILESQLPMVALGQPAEVTVDGLGDTVLRGHVESIVPATAAMFSQVQRNATDSTWIKVAQRIPVIVRITDPLPAGKVMVGASVEVSLLPGSAGRNLAAQAGTPGDGAADAWDIEKELQERMRRLRAKAQPARACKVAARP